MNLSEAIINSLQCKKKMEYYMWPCGIFNDEALEFKNMQCPQPTIVTKNIKLE